MMKKFIDYQLQNMRKDKTWARIISNYKVLSFKYGTKSFVQEVDDKKFIEKCCQKLEYPDHEFIYNKICSTLIVTLNISKRLYGVSFDEFCSHVCYDYVLYSILEAKIKNKFTKSRSVDELQLSDEITFENTLPDTRTISFLELPILRPVSRTPD